MANKAMDEFNRLMSHEMRAPLSKLVSIAENLRSFGKLGAEADRYVTMIEEAAKDALLQYSSILSMSRGSKREIVQFRPVELVERLMRQHALIAEHHQVRLNGAISGDRHASVPVDATDVFLIMTNLVSNALKHTTAGDAVVFSITVHEDSRSLELQVRDTGTGISEALRPRIYDAFVTTAAEMEINQGSVSARRSSSARSSFARARSISHRSLAKAPPLPSCFLSPKGMWSGSSPKRSGRLPTG